MTCRRDLGSRSDDFAKRGDLLKVGAKPDGALPEDARIKIALPHEIDHDGRAIRASLRPKRIV